MKEHKTVSVSSIFNLLFSFQDILFYCFADGNELVILDLLFFLVTFVLICTDPNIPFHLIPHPVEAFKASRHII